MPISWSHISLGNKTERQRSWLSPVVLCISSQKSNSEEEGSRGQIVGRREWSNSSLTFPFVQNSVLLAWTQKEEKKSILNAQVVQTDKSLSVLYYYFYFEILSTEESCYPDDIG